MTTNEIIEYYASLLIIQYANKPKAVATIKLLLKNVVMDQLPIEIQNGFNIDDAIGEQLDIIAKYVGVTRSAYNFSGPITLSDDDFRTMIKIGVLKNSSGSSLYDIQKLINDFFPDKILIFDFKTMRIGYFFDASIGSQSLVEVFVKNNFLPKPMGVGQTSLIYSNNISSFFGFRTYDQEGINITGYNNYDNYDEDAPWLSYANAISF